MYRVFEQVDQGWQLANEYEELPKKFALADGQLVELTSEAGVTTIVDEIPLTEEEQDA